MSNLHLQDAIHKLSTDEKYRAEIKTEPDKLTEEFNLDESQLEVFFIENVKKGSAITARLCCCC